MGSIYGNRVTFDWKKNGNLGTSGKSGIGTKQSCEPHVSRDDIISQDMGHNRIMEKIGMYRNVKSSVIATKKLE